MFQEIFEVRDSELDMGGIVNNANYLHYLEHARHKYLQSHGLSFSKFYQQGLNFVVVSYQLNYKQPLRSHDVFSVSCELVPNRSAFKINFKQEIRLISNEKLILSSECVAACINEKAKKKEERFALPQSIKILLEMEMDRNQKSQ